MSKEVDIIDFAGVHGLQQLPNLEHKIVQSLAICLDTDEYGDGTTEIQQLKIYGLPFKLITGEAFKKPDPKRAGSSDRSKRSSLSSADLSVVNRSFGVDLTELLRDEETIAEIPQMLAPLQLLKAPDTLLDLIHSEITHRFGRYGYPNGLIQEAEKSHFVLILLNQVLDFVEQENPFAKNFFNLRVRVHFKMLLDGEPKNTYADHAIVVSKTGKFCVIIECKAENCDQGAKQLVAHSMKAYEENACEDTIFGFSTIASDFSMLRYDSSGRIKLSEQFRFLFSRMGKSAEYKAQWKRENCLIVHLLYTILTTEIKKSQSA